MIFQERHGLPIVAGKKVFCENTPDGSWRATLRSKSMTVTTDAATADIFVVSNPNSPSKKIIWHAILSGGSICNWKYIASTGHSGVGVTYKSALASKRQIWCSESFKELHKSTYHILLSKVQGTSWSWLPSKDKLLDVARKRCAGSHGGEVVAFLTLAEQRGEDGSHEQPKERDKIGLGTWRGQKCWISRRPRGQTKING